MDWRERNQEIETSKRREREESMRGIICAFDSTTLIIRASLGDHFYGLAGGLAKVRVAVKLCLLQGRKG